MTKAVPAEGYAVTRYRLPESLSGRRASPAGSIARFLALRRDRARSLIRTLLLDSAPCPGTARSAAEPACTWMHGHSDFVHTQTSLDLARDLENAEADITPDGTRDLQTFDPGLTPVTAHPVAITFPDCPLLELAGPHGSAAQFCSWRWSGSHRSAHG